MFEVVITPEKTIFRGPIVPDFCNKPEPIESDYKYDIHRLSIRLCLLIIVYCRFKTGSTTVLKKKEIKFDIVESMDMH